MPENNLFRYQAHPVRVMGSLIEVALRNLKIGEVCEIRRSWKNKEIIAKAIVLGFRDNITLLSLIGTPHGFDRDVVISPTGREFSIPLSENTLGSVMTSSGEVIEKFKTSLDYAPIENRTIYASPPGYHQRKGISLPVITGVRAIDGMITCGVGQRMGIFASAGCGKTTLMQMIINNAQADIFVVALIGERGREVTEFIEELRESGMGDRCVVVYATSDFSATERMNAAAVAMTAAEYFRDHGNNVVLFLDSITRYARAVRDVALLAGEPPARRGYPASVFERLSALLERPGVTHLGSITGFFTILLEGEDESDPVAEEIRSILDGHIILSRKLASRYHYPAIDVLRSISRITSRVCESDHLEKSARFRTLLAEIEELQVLIDFGEYKPGSDTRKDRIHQLMPAVHQFLCQGMSEKESFDQTIRRMNEIFF